MSEQSGARVRGFCPRVWTPMESGDGLLVRVRPGLHGFTSQQLRALVTLAEQLGNGQLEVTRRANLQLRGVREAGLTSLQQQLVALGLAAASERDEQRQLLLVDPLWGIDPGCPELLWLAQQLEQALSEAPFQHRLSAKLLVVLEGSGPLELASDIRITLHESRPELAWLAIAEQPVGALPAAHVAETVVGLLAALGEAPFLGATRMRELVTRGMLPSLLARLRWLEPAPQLRQGKARSLIGFHQHWFGLAIPFGSAAGADWLRIAQLAERHANGQVRLTSQRSLLLPGVLPEAAANLAHEAEQAGLIVSEADPLLRVVACPGAPACASAYGETRALARSLAVAAAPLLTTGAHLHVSGCSKSCAHSGPCDITLLHTAEGSKLGIAQDAASSAHGPTLSLHEAHARLAQLAHEPERKRAH